MMPSKKFTSNTSLALPSAIVHDDDLRRLSRGRQRFPLPGRRWRPEARCRIFRRSPSCPGKTIRRRRSSATSSTRTARPVEFTPRNVLKRVHRSSTTSAGWKPVVAPEIEFYLVTQEPRPGLSADAAGRPLGPADRRRRRLFDRRRQRVRRADRRHLPFLRKPGPRDRHPDPRGGRRPARDQPAPRRPDRARRPGLPVQAHHPRGGAEARHLCDLHGQADAGPARLGHAHPPVGRRHEDRQEHLLRRGRRGDRRRSSTSSAACRNTCRTRW